MILSTFWASNDHTHLTSNACRKFSRHRKSISHSVRGQSSGQILLGQWFGQNFGWRVFGVQPKFWPNWQFGNFWPNVWPNHFGQSFGQSFGQNFGRLVFGLRPKFWPIWQQFWLTIGRWSHFHLGVWWNYWSTPFITHVCKFSVLGKTPKPLLPNHWPHFPFHFTPHPTRQNCLNNNPYLIVKLYTHPSNVSPILVESCCFPSFCIDFELSHRLREVKLAHRAGQTSTELSLKINLLLFSLWQFYIFMSEKCLMFLLHANVWSGDNLRVNACFSDAKNKKVSTWYPWHYNNFQVSFGVDVVWVLKVICCWHLRFWISREVLTVNASVMLHGFAILAMPALFSVMHCISRFILWMHLCK